MLVVPASTSADLAIIRSLGRRRVRVFAGVAPGESDCRYSRYCAGTLPIPDRGEAGVEAVLRGLRTHGVTHLICSNDDFMMVLDRHRDALERFAELLLPPLCQDKDHSLEIARDLGIPVEEPRHAVDVPVTVLMQHGNPVMLFQYRRSRNFVESVPPDETLLRHSVSLLRAMEWDGIATVEFRQDPRSGAAAFVGVTGRFADSLPLALRCGADLPYQLYLASLGHRIESAPYRAGVRCRRGFWAADDPLPSVAAAFHRFR